MFRVDIGGWALLLIAFGFAYMVCLKASKESSKLFRYVGYVIGILMLLISLALAISDISNRIMRRRRISGPAAPTTRPRLQLPRKSVGITEPKKPTQ